MRERNRSQHGLARTLINNMVVGVTQGFEKKLQLVGVGYKAEKKGDTLVMNLGYSHPVQLGKTRKESQRNAPDPQQTVTVKGIDKAQVGDSCGEHQSMQKTGALQGQGYQVRW